MYNILLNSTIRYRIAVVVIVVTLVGGIVWLASRSQPEPEPDIFTGWERFEDAEIGVRLRYPSGWSVEKDASTAGVGFTSAITKEKIIDIEKQYGKESCPVCAPNIIVSSFDNLQDDPSNSVGVETVEDLVEKDASVTFLGRAQVGNLVAIEVQKASAGDHYVLYLEKDGRFYKIYFAYQEDRQSLTAEEKKIVSSLEIIR